MKKNEPKVTARVWLIKNDYPEVVAILDEYVANNKSRGSGERRNFWDLLVGRRNGEGINRNGFVFPILE